MHNLNFWLPKIWKCNIISGDAFKYFVLYFTISPKSKILSAMY